MTEFCAPRAKTYALKDDSDKEMKKVKGTKKCVIKNELKIDDYKTSVFEGEKIIRSELRFRSDHHNVFTEEVNKVAISSNHDKRIKE